MNVRKPRLLRKAELYESGKFTRASEDGYWIFQSKYSSLMGTGETPAAALEQFEHLLVDIQMIEHEGGEFSEPLDKLFGNQPLAEAFAPKCKNRYPSMIELHQQRAHPDGNNKNCVICGHRDMVK